MLKKINALLTFIALLFAGIHITVTSVINLEWMLPDETPLISTVIFMSAVVLHAALSMFILFFNKSDSTRMYAARNVQTAEQRISAIVMLMLILVHYASYCGSGLLHSLAESHSFFTFIFEMLFVTSFISHIMSSLDRAFLTLGIHFKPVVIIVRLLYLLIYILSIAANIKMYFFPVI